MKTQNESGTESGTKQNENRKNAGFELAAEPKEVLFFFSTIYWMFGISVFLVIMSIICWLFSPLVLHTWEYIVWSVFATLSIGLIIGLPQFFAHIINFAILLCYWIAFCIFVLVRTIQHSIWLSEIREGVKARAALQGTSEELAELDGMMAGFIVCSVIILLLTLLVTLLMTRMTLYYYKNR